MPKRKNLSPRQIRAERFSIPLSHPEKNLIGTAAGIAGESPTAWARSTLKRFGKMVLQKAGVKVRLDLDNPNWETADFTPPAPKKPRRKHPAPMEPVAPIGALEPPKGQEEAFRFPSPEEDE